MKNDYTDYIQHAFGHRYVAKVKTANGNRYFYTQEEYDAYRNGEGLYGAFKRYDDKQAAFQKSFGDALTRYRTNKKNTQKREFINGRQAGIHQTPTRGAMGAAYTVKNKLSSLGSSAKKAMTNTAAAIGSTKVTRSSKGPQAPASVYGAHKVNNAKNAVKNAATTLRDKTLGAPDSNSRYRVTMRKAKNAVKDAGKALDRTFGHGEKNNRMNVIERSAMKARGKIANLEYNVSKKVKSLLGKGKGVSPELAAKMTNSVNKARQDVASSGASAEEIKMMNDKLDKILSEINANKAAKQSTSHPAYNQGYVPKSSNLPTSRPAYNQGYVPKVPTIISNPSALPQKMREREFLERAAKNEKNMTSSQKELQKQFTHLMTTLSRNKKKKK